ncbi:hypothetical protein M3Y95_01132900 [Aphelenchoides besseyi]|nr:hypothetical protein M3Y95_01132900 [Aphelenchoides besseyi]
MSYTGSTSDYFYGPYIFWLSLLYRSLSTSTSFSVYYMICERIAVFIWPFSIVKIQHRLVLWNLFTFVLIFSYFNLMVPLIDTIPTTYSKCSSLSCLLVVFHDVAMTTPKMIASTLTVVSAFVFAYKLSKHQRQQVGSQGNFRRANLISIFACFSELILNALPFFIGTILTLNKISLTSIIGPYHLVCTATDSILTAIIYRAIISRKLSSIGSVGSVTHVRVITVTSRHP